MTLKQKEKITEAKLQTKILRVGIKKAEIECLNLEIKVLKSRIGSRKLDKK